MTIVEKSINKARVSTSIHSTLNANDELTTTIMMAACDECGKVFHNKSNLNRHRKVIHLVNELEQYENEDEESVEKEEQQESEEDDVSEDEDETSEDEEVDLWKVIVNEAAADDGDVVESYKRNV